MDIDTPCSHSVNKYLKATDNSYLHWNGSQLNRLDSSFKIKTIESAENIPNFTHIHLIANLSDYSEQADFDTLTSIIENSSFNILRILSLTSNDGNTLIDAQTLSDAAIHSVTVMKEVASSVLHILFPLHKIITILILIIIVIILITIIFVLVMRHILRRKKRIIGKKSIRHLKSILITNNDNNDSNNYKTPQELDLSKLPRRPLNSRNNYLI